MKRLLACVALAAGLVIGLALPASAQEAPPKLDYKPLVQGENLRDSCRRSGNVVVVVLNDGEEEQPLDVYTRAACVSTLALNQLSTAAYRENCKVLEEGFARENASGKPYPYTFYGNPAYRAENRRDCIRFLRGFHTGTLPPGPPTGGTSG